MDLKGKPIVPCSGSRAPPSQMPTRLIAAPMMNITARVDLIWAVVRCW